MKNSMIEEMKIVTAFVFERLGKKKVSQSEFYLCLSMDLRWCSVAQAKHFMNKALEQGLLSRENDHLKSNFSIDDVSIPLGFKPSPKLFDVGEKEESEEREEEKGKGMDNLLSKIANLCSVTEDQILKEIKDIEREKEVFKEVALLLYAHSKGVEVSNYIDKVYESVKNA